MSDDLERATERIRMKGRNKLLQDGFFGEQDGMLKGLTGKPFHWEAEFPEVFLDGGFNCIIGNPPHGGDLTKEERSFVERVYHLGKGYKNTAFLFLELARWRLAKGGKMGMVIPKSLLFSQEWKKVRDYLRKEVNIDEIADISRAFKGVLLEQVVLLVSGKGDGPDGPDGYLGLRLHEHTKTPVKYRISLQLCQELDAFPILIDDTGLQVYQKIRQAAIPLGSISMTFRGFPYQTKLTDRGGSNCEPVLRGENVRRFAFADPKEYIDSSLLQGKRKRSYMRTEKIITQRLVAHIKNPVEHIAIMAALDSRGLANIDTVENIVITDDRYDPRYILGLLNSRLIGWYVYYFVFCNAIRTMDFDCYYVSKIPVIPLSEDSKTKIEVIQELVSQILELAEQKRSMFETFQKLTSNYDLQKDRPLEYYVSVTRASSYGIDLTASQRGDASLTGVPRAYFVDLVEDCIVIEVDCVDGRRYRMLQLRIAEEDVRNYFYLSLKRWEGPKNYRHETFLLETVLKDLKVAKSKKANVSLDVKLFKSVIGQMEKTFSKKLSEAHWSPAPLTDFKPLQLVQIIGKMDQRLNDLIYDLFNLSQEEIDYIESRTTSLTRFI